MSTFCNLIARCRLICAVMVVPLALALATIVAEAKTIYWGRSKKTVAIDPGHGGIDTGARSADGLLEKQVTLDLARLLASELEDAHKVLLTRTDDYRVEIEVRTDIANNEAADVFISLHAGGSFSPVSNGMGIYYFKETAAPASSNSDRPARKDEQLMDWDQIQLKHIRTSRLLARHLKETLAALLRTKVATAPVLVLRGADMPAVLVEIGYLSNPQEARKLRDSVHLQSVARAIAGGVEAFLEELRKAP